MKTKLAPKVWLSILIFGLFGQLAWTIENMYFNVFVYNTISANPNVIANMVAASALTATITTFVMGTLSDRFGKRKIFMTGGYILWGLSTMAFAWIRIDVFNQHFAPAAAVNLAVITVILMDCVMTFFGSTANDAAFNAWVNDMTEPSVRGRVESVIAILPLIAMILIFGLMDGLTQGGHWDIFFILIGSLVTLGGILGIFIIEEPPAIKRDTSIFLSEMIYTVKLSTVLENKQLYLSFAGIAIVGISMQVFNPYLIIYIQKYLMIENYALLFGIVLTAASILSVLSGRLIDRFGSRTLFIPYLSITMMGLIGMFFSRSTIMVILFGILLIGGMMVLLAMINATIRNFTPQHRVGLFQGIRMVFTVLIPMVIGPYIGSMIITQSQLVYEEFGIIKPVPGPQMFLGAALVLLFVLIPFTRILREVNQDA